MSGMLQDTSIQRLIGRKRIEIGCKLDSLKDELDMWRCQSEIRMPFEKHHTQIRRVTDQLLSLVATIEGRIGNILEEKSLMAEWQDVEIVVLELHRIWEFYRRKFALRSLDPFRSYLSAADEFAWECYAPFVQAASRERMIPPESVKEPPLVFLSGSASPFVLSRGSAFTAEELLYGIEDITEFADLLRDLPIPVVGIPWFQIRHLPDAMVIAHEVGHIVEHDLQLKERVVGMLTSESIGPSNRDAWVAWRGEVFADIFGVVVAGPAFVEALIDFLAVDAESLASEHQAAGRWKNYPTVHLRIALCIKALHLLGFEEESTALGAEWNAICPDHAMKQFDGDLDPVVRALVRTKLIGDYALPDVPLPSDRGVIRSVQFTQADLNAVRTATASLLKKEELRLNNARNLFAAARFAFATASKQYLDNNVQQRILRRMDEIKTSGVRGSADARHSAAEQKPQVDAERSDSLFKRILKMHGR